MALYDNSHWLLAHIRTSFVHDDKTGKSEIVMAKDNFSKTLISRGALYVLPNAQDSDEEDMQPFGGSSDIEISNLDKECGYRQRTNTAQRLEKMDLERRRASKIKHIKWEYNPNNINLEEQKELFKKKDLKETNKDANKRSLLSEQLEKCNDALQANPFVVYAKFDGDVQIDVPVKRVKVFICMLPKNQRYPLPITVLTSCKVEEFIGLICYKFFNDHPEMKWHSDVSKYGLFMTEDDGEIDWDFPCLNPKEPISKYDFSTLGLIELKSNVKAPQNFIEIIPENSKKENLKLNKIQEEVAKDLAKMAIHTNAMEAPLYQSYRVYIINKVRTKTEVHLGISGEKLEIDPVATSKGASRFWHRQRAVSYHMDNVAWCELTEHKGSKTTFTLVYSPHTSITLDGLNVSISHTQSLRRSASFKNHDFEAESSVAEEIVQKINHILELRNSASRKEYLAQKERKALRRKSFHIHR